MRSRRSRTACLAALLAIGTGASGCDDIHGFEGAWQGAVSADPTLAKGFAAGDVAHASVGAITRDRVALTVTLPGATDATTFQPIRSASADALGQMRLPGEPLRTFVGYLEPAAAGGAPYFTVVSFYAEKRIELRLVRGADETYGVFTLTR